MIQLLIGIALGAIMAIVALTSLVYYCNREDERNIGRIYEEEEIRRYEEANRKARENEGSGVH